MNTSGPLLAFRDYAASKLADHCAQIARCVALLATEQVWQRPNAHSNSVGNLLLHLHGNVTQWILSGLGGTSFARDRPAEFAQRDALPASELLQRLQAAVSEACGIITRLDDARLAESVAIQGYRTTVMAAVFHVVEHFAFHTGQIVWTAKAMLDIDLSLYDAQGRRLDHRTHGVP